LDSATQTFCLPNVILGAGLCASIRKCRSVVHGKSKLSLCELAQMEDSSFFRDQAERCRRQAENVNPMLQIILETLAVDCIAYADELDHPDDYWFANRTQTETETTSPTKPRWSAIQKILIGVLVIMTPGIFVLAALML
jgi:hypothetical protein